MDAGIETQTRGHAETWRHDWLIGALLKDTEAQRHKSQGLLQDGGMRLTYHQRWQSKLAPSIPRVTLATRK